MRDHHEWDQWFEALFRDHARAVHRYFARRAPADDVQDLAAEVFATAWRRRADVPEEAELPWLYRTAGYVLANHRRKGRPVPVAEVPQDPSAIDDADPEHLVLADEQVREALGRLSPRDRRILLLHAWDGVTGEALAAVLGVSRGGADAALSRARARLREAWTDADDASADGATGPGGQRVGPPVQAPGGSGHRHGDDARTSRTDRWRTS